MKNITQNSTTPLLCLSPQSIPTQLKATLCEVAPLKSGGKMPNYPEAPGASYVTVATRSDQLVDRQDKWLWKT
jgi:hypothetical protein